MSSTQTYHTVGGRIEYKDKKMVIVCDTMVIPGPNGKPVEVRKLCNDEARAKISEEYGFEYGSIVITADCWYEATDMNYFSFEVKCRGYEVRDFGDLQTL